jgi:hypothetical protein
MAAACSNLSTEMLVILARLLGREMAQRLDEELAVTDVPRRTSTARPHAISFANP